VIIGIDPHKATHMAVAIDGDERSIARFEVRAQRNQSQRLLVWAAPFPDRRWAIEFRGRARQVARAAARRSR